MKMTMLLHVLKIKKNQITTTNNENYIITFLNHPQLLLLLLPLYYYTTILLNDYTIQYSYTCTCSTSELMKFLLPLFLQLLLNDFHNVK